MIYKHLLLDLDKNPYQENSNLSRTNYRFGKISINIINSLFTSNH